MKSKLKIHFICTSFLPFISEVKGRKEVPRKEGKTPHCFLRPSAARIKWLVRQSSHCQACSFQYRLVRIVTCLAQPNLSYSLLLLKQHVRGALSSKKQAKGAGLPATAIQSCSLRLQTINHSTACFLFFFCFVFFFSLPRK